MFLLRVVRAIRIVAWLGVQVDVCFGDVECEANAPCIVESETKACQ